MASRKDRDFGPKGVDYGTSDQYERGLIQMGKPRSRASARAAKILVWSVLIGLIGLNVLNLGVANANRQQGNSLEAMTTSAYNPSFKVRYDSLGAEVIKAWYDPAISASPIALGAGITWPANGSTSTPADSGSSNATSATTTPSVNTGSIAVSSVAFIGGQQIKTPANGNAYQEDLSYSAYINGNYYRVSVTIGISDLSNPNVLPTLISPPTITSQVATVADPSAKPGEPVQWQKYDVQSGLTTQINAWARAWTTNDPVALKQVTGDGGGSYYAGLTPGQWGYVDTSLSVLWAYTRPNEQNATVAEVQWSIKLPDTSNPDPQNSSNTIHVTGATQVQRMDLLIQDAGSGLPKIVAWGPTGTYGILAAGQNALTKAQFDALPQTSTSTNGN